MSDFVEDHPSKFQRFFVFNSSWGPTEDTEQDKIVYFHPKDDENQPKHVGLVEALITFMKVFSEHPANVQHNLKTKTVFQEFEPGFYMVLSVAAPFRVKNHASEDQKETNYFTEKLHDNVLTSILQRTYDMFKVFTGGFTHHGADHDSIRTKCDTFFSRFIPSLNFSSNHLNLVNDLFGAVQFLTLESLDFLHVQSFVNKVENDFPCIDKSLFLHHGNIVWSGIQQKETQLLYYYVYHTLLPNSSSKLSGKNTF